MAQIIKENPNITPSQIQSACILSAFRENADWRKVEKEAEATLDKKWIPNLKHKIKKHTEPVGHDLKAILTFKQYCDQKDEYFV